MTYDLPPLRWPKAYWRLSIVSIQVSSPATGGIVWQMGAHFRGKGEGVVSIQGPWCGL
jgi:hypothetical protein